MINIIEIVRRNKIENIILKVIIIVIISITVILNSDFYKEMFQDEILITNEVELDKNLNQNKRFVTLDLTSAELTRFSLQNNESKEIEINTYKIEYEDKILLIFLNENTAITNKVRGELDSFTLDEEEIKDKIKEESNNKEIINVCFSNINYKIEEKIVKYKFLFSISLFCILILSIFIDIFLLFNPNKTHKYKKYRKKSIDK